MAAAPIRAAAGLPWPCSRAPSSIARTFSYTPVTISHRSGRHIAPRTERNPSPSGVIVAKTQYAEPSLARFFT
jgi:hypothetical protein